MLIHRHLWKVKRSRREGCGCQKDSLRLCTATLATSSNLQTYRRESRQPDRRRGAGSKMTEEATGNRDWAHRGVLWPDVHPTRPPVCSPPDAIQRTDAVAGAERVSLGEGEGLGTVLWEGRPPAPNPGRLPRLQRGPNRHVPRHPEGGRAARVLTRMIQLPYSLVIEATEDRDFFGFYSP